MSFHHKRIHKFSIEGVIYDEAHVERLRREYLALLVLSMKQQGYVMRLELDEDFTIDYLGPKKGFAFKMSVYGCYIGKKKAQEIDALDGARPMYPPSRVHKTEVR